ncbi:MAG TPA: hypothetical protein VF591_17225 [Pyrinomonadaceae bacterium]|jgi:hypothetical protein
MKITRHGSITRIIRVTALLFLATQAACINCCNKPTETDAEVRLNGEVGSDCGYDHWSAIGQQQVYVTVKGSCNYSWSQNFPKAPNNTYAVKVPSKGSFKITVAAEETDGQTCPACQNKCGPNQTANATSYWTGEASFQSVAPTYNVTLGWNPNDGCKCL